MRKGKKVCKVVVGNNNTIIRAISKSLDRQLQSLFRDMKKDEKITFLAATTKMKVKKK